MFIKSLHLHNWLSHQDTTLELDKLVSVRGANGGGKSSVEQAIQYLLTGRCEGTNDKGAGSRDLIRRGADKSAITAEILNGSADAIKMRASLTEKSGRTVQVKKEADPSWTGSDWLGMLALQRETLDCLSNSRYFVGMDDARQKALLAAIILPAQVKFDPWVESAVNQCGLAVDWSMKAWDLIALAYDKAYKERTLINRIIKEWKEPEPVTAQTMDLKEIQARIGQRQNERTQLAVDRQRILDKWERANTGAAKLGEKIKALEDKLVTEQTRRAAVAKDQLSKTALKEAERLAAGAEKAKKIDADIARIQADVAAYRKQMSRVNALCDAGLCPTCTQPISDDFIQTITTPIIEQISVLDNQERDLQAARKDLGDYAGAQRCLEAHAQAEKNLVLVDSHIADVEKEIKELTNERAQAVENSQAKPATSDLDAKIADLDARLQKGNAALTAAIQAETNRRHYDEAIEAKKKLDAKQGLLERLLDHFGPKGIQAKLLDEHVGGFQASMNAILSVWGYEAHLQFEPYEFGISFAGKPEVYTLRTISKSQKHSFAIAFQVALARVTGINFVVVDEADMLLDANRGMLYKALIGAGLDQCIVLQSDLRREVPKVPNAAFYMLSLDKSGDVPTTMAERL
jgi:exonuclease SbcC